MHSSRVLKNAYKKKLEAVAPKQCVMGHWIFSKDPNAKCKICSGDKEYIKKLPIRNIVFKGIKVQFSKT